MLPPSAAGANLGWDLMEGTHGYDGGSNPDGGVLPVFEYDHGEGCSITGGVVYRGTGVPGLAGAYLFTDFCEGTIRAVRVTGGGAGRRAGVRGRGNQPGVVRGGPGRRGLRPVPRRAHLYRIDPAG